MDDVASLSLRNRWSIPANALCAITYICRSERPLPQKISDKLPALLDRVLNGMMSVQEAHAEYGEPGNRRPRRFRTFADYLDERIRFAEDTAVEQQLREMLTRSVGARHYSSSQARSAETVRVDRLLGETGRAHADRLRELKAELDDAAYAPVRAISHVLEDHHG